jgi:2-polyprenyl-6-hydroxyphenyl methylase/3-demethylubiquinone-9 3-methyltransferase
MRQLSGEEWLDVGCGTGFFSRMLAGRGAKVTGIDGSREMIAAGIDQAERARLGGDVDFRGVEGLDCLAFDDASFDGCICFSVFEYLDAPSCCLAEIARVLKPGGCFVGSFPNASSLVRRAQLLLRANGGSPAAYLATSRHSWAARDLASLLSVSGLALSARKGFDPLLPRGLQGLLPPSLHFVVAQKSNSSAPG